MKKRILSMLLAIVMVVTLLPTVAQAAAGFSVTTKVLSGGGSLPAQYNLPAGQTVTLQPIPDEGYGVYSIEAEDRYHNRIQLTDRGDGSYTFTMPNCEVSVEVEFAKRVGSVGFLSSKFTLEMGKTLDLKEEIYFTPFLYLPTRLTWSSDNNSVATVDSEGNVTAVGEGVANITATAIDGTKTDGVSPSGSCKITVKKTSTITFDTDGGTTIAPITKAVGESFSVANPTKDGYTFAGWEPALPRYMPEENTTFTAQWTKNYTITQDPNTINGTLYFAKDYNYDEPVTAAAQGDTIAVFWEHAEGYVLDYETDISVRTEAGDAVEVEFFEFTMPSDNVIVSASFVLEDYVIGVAASEGGEAEVDKETANFGDIVTVTAKPDTGYVVKSVTVTQDYSDLEPCSLEEEDEQPIDVTDNDDGTYSFTMPASDVAVNVEFELLAYDVWVGGVQITGANKDDITAAITAAGGNATGTATYDPDTNTLTLNNFSYEGAGHVSELEVDQNYFEAVIFSDDALKIQLVGDNVVTHVNSTDNASYGIAAWGDLTVAGTGTLTATGGEGGFRSAGLYSFEGDVTIAGGSIIAHGKEAKQSSSGILANYGSMIISGGEVTAQGQNEANYSAGLIALWDIMISGAKVNATAGDADVCSAGIFAYAGAVKISGGTVTAKGVGAGGMGIVADTLVISGGTVEATGELWAVGSLPTFNGDIAVSAGDDAGSATEKDASAAATYQSKYVKIVQAYPVWVGGEQFTSEKLSIEGDSGTATYDPDSKTLTLNNFSYTGKGYKYKEYENEDDPDERECYYAAVYSENDLTIKLVGNNTVTYEGEGTSDSFHGIYTENCDLTICDDTTDNKIGSFSTNRIASNGELTILGVNVTTKYKLNALYSANDLLIQNSTVSAAANFNAITCYRNITIEESNVTATATDAGEWEYGISHRGILTIKNSIVEISSGNKAINADGGTLIPTLEFDGSFVVLAGDNKESADKADKSAADTYTAKYIKIVPVYTVTYKADGKVIKTVEVEHGKNTTAPAIPEKEGYNETAPKWDKNGKNITADTVINAVYTKNEPGEYADVTPDTNIGGGKLTEEIEELKEKVPFTQEEEKQIEYGADVEVWLEIKDISDSVSAEDKAKVDEKLGDADVALYLDIAMFKQVGENEASRLTQLGDRVQICFKLADSLINTDKNVTRTYSIIRVHNGKAEIITPVFDAATKTLTFETDRFSTYAVVYTDVENVPPTQETTPPAQETTPPTEETTPPTEETTPPTEETTSPTEETTPPTEETTPPTEETVPPTEETVPPTEKPAPPAEIPATGDSFRPAFWIACMTLSIFGIAVLLLDAKRRHAR